MANLHGGGAERVTVNIIRKLDPDLYHITLLMVRKEGEFLTGIPDYVNIVDLNIEKTIFSIYKVRNFVKNYHPHIVYSTMFHTTIALALALIGIKDKPYVVLRNPTSPKLLAEEGELSYLWKKLLLFSYKHADRILAQTPEMRDEIIEYYHVASDKIKILINPLDTEMIDNMIQSQTNPFDNRKINIVTAGRLTYAKAYDTLLYAFKSVIEKDDRYFLNIIGKDDGEEIKLKELCKKLGLNKYVKFWGFQENPYRFYFYGDLYVLSSRREGMPNALLENVYLKKPVVATNCIPFMKELVQDSKNGFIVPVDDVDALSNAILNYENLAPDFTTYKTASRENIGDLLISDIQ